MRKRVLALTLALGLSSGGYAWKFNELLTRVVVQRNRLSDTNSVICRHCFLP